MLLEWCVVLTIAWVRKLFELCEWFVCCYEDLVRLVMIEMGKTIVDVRVEVVCMIEMVECVCVIFMMM